MYCTCIAYVFQSNKSIKSYVFRFILHLYYIYITFILHYFTIIIIMCERRGSGGDGRPKSHLKT